MIKLSSAAGAVAAVALGFGTLAFTASCPGGKGGVDDGTGPGPVTADDDDDVTGDDDDIGTQVAEVSDDAAARRGLAEPNEPPVMEIPAYERIGVGQEIAFGLATVDEESDAFTVELIDKPDSASFDPYTVTVSWKPTRKDMPIATFTARITEKVRSTGQTRVFEHSFAIDVTRRKQPLPVARPLGPVVETLLTIHDPARLAEVNKRWPMQKMLMVNIDRAWAALSDEDKKKVAKPTPKQVYDGMLHNLALAHDNPRVDPASKDFDRATFGKPGDWEIIAVRPRLDKTWHEVRIVYRSVADAETFAMFRMRPIGDETPAEARAFNNRAFQKIVLDHFFTEDGELDAANMTNKRRHARKVADFLDAVIGYSSAEHPWSKPGIMPLPFESRLGGGTIRGDDGSYSGDGWAWNAMKPMVSDGKLGYGNVPIKGFVSHIEPNEAGTAWAMACGPRFDPDSDAHVAGYEKLCRPTGHTDMPASGDGYTDVEKTGGAPVTGKKDAVNMYVAHKNEHTVATVPLTDPRRDIFEEKGMTCSQCHTRRFGVSNLYDKSVIDPRAGAPETHNKQLDTTFFVIVPTTHWQPFMLDFQQFQECEARAAFLEFSEVETSLGCPLKVSP